MFLVAISFDDAQQEEEEEKENDTRPDPPSSVNEGHSTNAASTTPIAVGAVQPKKPFRSTVYHTADLVQPTTTPEVKQTPKAPPTVVVQGGEQVDDEGEDPITLSLKRSGGQVASSEEIDFHIASSKKQKAVEITLLLRPMNANTGEHEFAVEERPKAISTTTKSVSQQHEHE